MIKFNILWMIFFINSFFSLEAFSNTDEKTQVILISLDGLKDSLITEKLTPNIWANLARNSYRIPGAYTINPSLTLPSHTSMLTGVDPSKHRIYWNDYLPKRRRSLTWATIFDFVTKKGDSVSAIISKKKLLHLFPYDDIGNNLVQNLNRQLLFIEDAKSITDQFFKTINDTLFRKFIFLHFREIDLAGHQYGWDSYQQRYQISQLDNQLGRIIQKLNSITTHRIYLIITSDHGGHWRIHGQNRESDRHIPWIISSNFEFPQCFEFQTKIKTYDTFSTILQLLQISPQTSVPGKTLDGQSAIACPI